jgi:hypothetical protein
MAVLAASCSLSHDRSRRVWINYQHAQIILTHIACKIKKNALKGNDHLKDCTSVNDARYMKFCTKNKIPEPQQLPPTKDELLLNCQSALTMNIDPPQPEGQGWLQSDGVLEHKWISQKPAPDFLLEFWSCDCKKSASQNNMCVCVSNGLNCTDLCCCNACLNLPLNTDDMDTYENFDSDPED